MIYRRAHGSARYDEVPAILVPSELELEQMLRARVIGNFLQSDGIRSIDRSFVPVEGYRADFVIHGDDEETFIPGYHVAVSGEKTLDLFLELIQELDNPAGVRVFLESRHHSPHYSLSHTFVRDDIQLAEIVPLFREYQDSLCHDGALALGVLSGDETDNALEVYLDDHKVFQLWGNGVASFLPILTKFGVTEQPRMKLVWETEHVHASGDEHTARSLELIHRTGAQPVSLEP